MSNQRRGATRKQKEPYPVKKDKRRTETKAFLDKKGVSVEPSLNSVGWKQKIYAWFTNHRQVLASSFYRIWNTAFQSIVTTMVIAIAFALPIAMSLMIDNIKMSGVTKETVPQASIYLTKSISESDGFQLSQDLTQYAAVSDSSYLSKKQTLAEFEAHSNIDRRIFEQLEADPLPAVIVLQLTQGVSAQQAEQFLATLRELDGVDFVELDLIWIQRLNSIMDTTEDLTWIIAGLLSIGVVLVIGNTIRMMVENRRDEIVTIKLVGATDSFVRRPFVYAGFWFGLFGGVWAVIIVQSMVLFLRVPISELVSLYQGQFQLIGLSEIGMLKVIGFSATLGVLGAWFSVSQQLKYIQPK